MKSKNQPSKKLKNRLNYSVSALIVALLSVLPISLYSFICIFLFPAPNSGFLFLGFVGSFILSAGLICLFGLFSGFYPGHMITTLFLCIGTSLVGISAWILYTPSVYSLFDPDYVSHYFAVWVFLAVPLGGYCALRLCIDSYLSNYIGVSKGEMKQAKKGLRNYWWYETLYHTYDFGTLYTLNKFFLFTYPSTVLIHLLFGWWKYAYISISVLFCVACIVCAILWIWLLYHRSEKESKYGNPTNIFTFLLCFAAPIIVSILIVLQSIKLLRG